VRARAEGFGAWVRLDAPAALVAVDRQLARRLGVDGREAWADDRPRAPSAPLEAHLAVTARCGAACRGCYLDATPDGHAPPFDALCARLEALSEAGVFTVAFGGGEPLSRTDVHLLAARARALGLSPVMTTSGLGMTPRRAAELAAFDQVNVSYDGPGDAYRAVRGWDGADVAERAMGLLRAAGVRFGVNLVLTRQNFAEVEASVARAASLGASEAQLLRWKPAGRATGLDYLASRLTPAQVLEVYPLLERLVRAGTTSVRIDCAMVPFLAPHLDDPAALERFGVLGCEAGRHLGAITVDGAISPCSFSPPAAARADDAAEIARAWAADPTITSARNHTDAAPAPCSSCPLRAACRGGCRVVAAHAGDPSGPDPECPRVLGHRATEAARAPGS
jgi:radical SAM protein with 4Fe4S-binding SPASM domain